MSIDKEKWNYIAKIPITELFNPPTDQPHKGILMLVGELEKLVGKEKALEIVEDMRVSEKMKMAQDTVKANPITCFKDFLKLFEGELSNAWAHANIDESAVYTENSRNVNTVGCLFADVWRSWGAEDVGYAYCCAADFAFIKALHPNLRLERTKTLMQGDDCCDFKYIWDEE